MTQSPYCLIVFDSTHAAIAAERLLKALNPAVMPTLRAITASCGMSLRLKPEQTEQAQALMAASSIDPKLYRFYRIEQGNGETRCTLLA
ncbi:MAG: DUF3343 domain-containing protein [Clostridiaceae bacterium]